MKTYIFFILLISFGLQAQSNESKKFLNDFFKVQKEKIIYCNKIYPGGINDIKEALQTTTIQKLESKDSLTFTKDEINYVIQQFDENNNIKPKESFIANSQFISYDEIEEIFGNKLKRWGYFHKNIGQQFYTIGLPVFIRNNSICFFYIDNSCDSLCGNGSFAVYIKENDVWKLYATYLNWIS